MNHSASPCLYAYVVQTVLRAWCNTTGLTATDSYESRWVLCTIIAQLMMQSLMRAAAALVSSKDDSKYMTTGKKFHIYRNASNLKHTHNIFICLTFLCKSGCFTAYKWQQPTAYRGQETRENLSLSLCYWLVSQVRVGNWLTQWQRSHLSHHRQPTVLSSSNFLQHYQIVPMIASSQPGSSSFHDSMLFPPPLSYSQPLYLPQRSTEGCDKFGAFKGNQQSLQPICKVPANWGQMIEMLISD